MKELALPLVTVEVQSDGLWLYNKSILANFMGGWFSIDQIDRHSVIVGNPGRLTFMQIVDFFDTWHSEKNSGIFRALALSEYMGCQQVFDAISNKLSALLEKYPHTKGINNTCYSLAVSFRDGYANHLLSIANTKCGEYDDTMIASKGYELEHCRHLAIKFLRSIVFEEIAKFDCLQVDSYCTQERVNIEEATNLLTT